MQNKCLLKTTMLATFFSRKRIFLGLLIITIILTGFQSQRSESLLHVQSRQEEDDTLIWRAANHFIAIFNQGDVVAMGKLLPDDFMLQWLHENFLEKKGLLAAMLDSALHSTLKHLVNHDDKAIIRYSDEHNAASLNTGFKFLDPVMAELIKKENGYGLCIMYFQKKKGRWLLQTVHLDLHCTLCNL